MLHFNCSPTIFYLHQIWHQTCFSSIFNISLLNFLPKHYIIRNIISSESIYSFLQNTNMQKSKYLISKILLKSFHNQCQFIIIAKCNDRNHCQKRNSFISSLSNSSNFRDVIFLIDLIFAKDTRYRYHISQKGWSRAPFDRDLFR